jgi:hypothetical protein
MLQALEQSKEVSILQRFKGADPMLEYEKRTSGFFRVRAAAGPKKEMANKLPQLTIRASWQGAIEVHALSARAC